MVAQREGKEGMSKLLLGKSFSSHQITHPSARLRDALFSARNESAMPPKRFLSTKNKVAPKRPKPSSGCLEFCAPCNDAWYAVGLRLEGKGVLRVIYCEFSEEFDERFEADCFGSSSEVEEFRGRFRRPSVQMQDQQCGAVIEGMGVCASHAFGESELRYYNAVVEAVRYSTHSLAEGKDVCSCTFVVLWQQGPLAGEKTTCSIENICLLQQGSVIEPMLEKFLDMAWKNLEARNSQVGHIPESSRHELESIRRDLDSSIFKGFTSSGGKFRSSVDDHSKKPQFSPCKLEEMTISERTACKRRKFGQDIDLGSSKKGKNVPTEGYHFFRIENLEKDVSPCCIMDFIHEQTSLSSQAVICPAFSSDTYSNGTIFVETKEMADKLSDFLFNPGYIIMSSRGKPWVMSESWCESMEGVMPFVEKQPRNNNKDHTSQIKLVHMGSEEYEKGERLLKIHKEFHDHAQLLRRRLAKIERELIQ